MRLRVGEAPSFERAQQHGLVAKNPVVTVFRNHCSKVVLAGLISIACPAIGYIYSVYLLSYGTTELGLSRSLILSLIVAKAVVQLVTILGAAVLADRIGKRRVFLLGAGMAAVWAIPFFLLIDTASASLILLSFSVMLLGSSLMAGPQAAMIASLFPANVRYSGTSTAYQIGSVVGGGFAPLIATSLFARFGSTVPTALYLLLLGAVSFAAIVALKIDEGGVAGTESSRQGDRRVLT
ncbi:MFS transporter [Gordonia terrae]